MITLTTDFGYKDPYAGIMKGVILGLKPDARIVDITHGITPHNIREAALKLAEAFRYFPQRTVHVVVVDPGVGSERRPIAVECDNHFFVGPDNGVFTKVIAERQETLQVRHITSSHYFLPPQGRTFHGRDIFAPVAAYMERGTRMESLGEPIDDYLSLELPSPTVKGHIVQGEVMYSDGFGNAVTNIRLEDLEAVKAAKPGGRLRVLLKGGQTDLKEHFKDGDDGKPHAHVNSSSYLEVFVYMRDATRLLKIAPGDKVTVMAG